jgi:hypothetical protein
MASELLHKIGGKQRTSRAASHKPFLPNRSTRSPERKKREHSRWFKKRSAGEPVVKAESACSNGATG